MKKLVFFLLTATLLCSCGPKRFYEAITPVNPKGWHLDSLQYYDFYLYVRNNTDYGMQNFYVFFTTEFPNGYKAQDTLGFVLCDKYGNWTGKGYGYLKENQFLFKPKVRFARCGTYTFTVQQAMREEQLQGIEDFGMALYEVK